MSSYLVICVFMMKCKYRPAFAALLYLWLIVLSKQSDYKIRESNNGDKFDKTLTTEIISMSIFPSTERQNVSGLYEDMIANESILYASESNTSISCRNENETSLCPPWHFCNSVGLCQCGSIPFDELVCGDNGTLSILDSFCATYNENKSRTELGSCIFNCEYLTDRDGIYRQLPTNVSDFNDAMCGKFNRQGSLCGSCKDDFYPLAYSFNLTCVKCAHGKYNWWKYVVVAFLPLTFFYFVILFFRINANLSHLQGFILYSQAVSFPVMCRVAKLAYHDFPHLSTAIDYIGALYGVWNLDFVRTLNPGICLETSTLVVNSLDLAVGLYPLFLMLLTYLVIHLYDQNFKPLVIVLKPFRALSGMLHRNWEIRTSLIDSFSTFFLLSNIKLLSVSYDLISPVNLHFLHPTGQLNKTVRLYFNANIVYLGHDHFPFAVIAFTVVFFFVLLPTLILLLYPFRLCRRCLNMLPFRWNIFLYTFVDSFQGCYKDGTEPGTRDCRWFSGIFLLFRFLLFFIYAHTLNMMYFVLASILLVIMCILILIIEPFKDNTRHAYFNITFLLYLSSVYVSVIGIDCAGVKAQDYIHLFYFLAVIFGALPLLYATGLVLHWMIKQKRFSLEMIQRFRAWRLGYEGFTLDN